MRTFFHGFIGSNQLLSEADMKTLSHVVIADEEHAQNFDGLESADEQITVHRYAVTGVFDRAFRDDRLLIKLVRQLVADDIREAYPGAYNQLLLRSWALQRELLQSGFDGVICRTHVNGYRVSIAIPLKPGKLWPGRHLKTCAGMIGTNLSAVCSPALL